MGWAISRRWLARQLGTPEPGVRRFIPEPWPVHRLMMPPPPVSDLRLDLEALLASWTADVARLDEAGGDSRVVLPGTRSNLDLIRRTLLSCINELEAVLARANQGGSHAG